jgi:hypothetical protein
MIAEVGYGSKPVNTSSQSFSKDMYMIDGAITTKSEICKPGDL